MFMPPTNICEIYTTALLTGLDLVTCFGHWNVSGHDAAEDSDVFVWFVLPCCTTGHRKMMKTHMREKSVVVVVSH